MKSRKQLFSTLLMVLGFAVASGQNKQAITFEDALQMMHERNPELQKARQEIKQKEYELKAKRGLYMPQVSLSAKAVSMSDMLHLDLSPVQDAIIPLYNSLGSYGVFSGVPNSDPETNQMMPVLPDEISTSAMREKLLAGGQEIAGADWDKVIQEKNFATVSADVMWPLFTGGKIKNANKAAGVDVSMSHEKMRQTEGLLLTELATRYYGLSLAIQVLNVRQQTLEVANQHYSNAQKLYDNGIIAKVELLHAQVSKNEAERGVKNARRKIEIIRAGLDATLSPDSAVHVIPASQLFINKELSGISYWITKANDKNPQLKQIDGKRELISLKNKTDKG
ncbi:MAG TPA: TolC family protein, partial [Prolixibacteraceae bacterium]|nr:TolC family protein [Prolixibacteraceae bacterium]